MRERGFTREQECSSSSQSPFQLMVYLKSGSQFTSFWEKSVTEEQTFLLQKLGYFSIKYGVFFTVEIIPLKGWNTRRYTSSAAYVEYIVLLSQYMKLLDFLSKVIVRKKSFTGVCTTTNAIVLFGYEHTLLKENRIGLQESHCEFWCV